MSISQPVVMITGAAGYFGKELIMMFRSVGYKVFATARAIPKEVELEDLWHKLDISIYEECAEAISFGFEQLGRIDVLVNNASAYAGGKTITDLSKEEIDRELDITLRGAIYLSKLYVDRARFQKSGKILFISSIAGLDQEPECSDFSVYSAAKAGINRFAECLNEDIQKFNMQSHVVIPCSMRSVENTSNSLPKNSVSYTEAANIVLEIAKAPANSLPTKMIIRPE